MDGVSDLHDPYSAMVTHHVAYPSRHKQIFGFDLSPYDTAVVACGDVSESCHALWEYDHKPLSEPHPLLSLTFADALSPIKGG